MRLGKGEICVFFSIVFLFSVASASAAVAEASSTPTIFLSPPVSTAQLGGNFTVSVNVANVEALYGYQFYVYWNETLLNWTAAEYGGFLGPEEELDWLIDDKQEYGWLGITASLTDPPDSAISGNGTLALITFLVEEEGETDLAFYGSKLVKVLGYTPEEIPHTTINGSFSSFGPVASFTYSPKPPLEDEEVTFNASASEAFDGFIANYTWDFGDGTPDVVLTDPIVKHAYNISGTYTVTLTVTDNKGLPNSVSQFVTVVPPHDVAVTRVMALPAEVAAGEIVTIEVDVENKGTYPETFNVTVYCDDTPIETRTVTDLAPGNSKSLSFSWDTTDVTSGVYYTIKAEASVVEGEKRTENNMRVDGTVTITQPGQPLSIVLIGAVMAIAAVGVSGFFYMRRRKS